jgi:hypothetical protein
MSKMLVVAIGAVLSAVLVAAQADPAGGFEGTWTGDVACRHGGGDTVTLSIRRDARGRLTGSSDWGLARSDGRKGPQIPFTMLTATAAALSATGDANGAHATLEATLEDSTLKGKWRIVGVDDEWTFVATKTSSPQRR